MSRSTWRADLNASVADAERIKTFYGSVLRRRLGRARHDHGADDRRGRARSRAVRAPRARSCTSSSRASRRFWKWSATGSKPRLSRPMRAAASSSPAAPASSTGLPELASHIFGRPVRIGRPLGIDGLAGSGERARPSRSRSACWSIRRPRTSSISKRAVRGSSGAARRRLSRPRRTVASGEFLMAPQAVEHQGDTPTMALRLTSSWPVADRPEPDVERRPRRKEEARR